ncbi:hypothetical protein lerEdw1_019165 [Lerista edwardsae]|nr:hypothetical protein lerEdw1_019165 [Lerista edwardsae]
MKRAAAVPPSAPEGGRAQLRRPGQRRSRQHQPGAGRLRQLGLAVRGFVEAAAGPAGLSALPGAAPPSPGRSRRQSRRELRRDRRRLKRGRRRRHWLRDGEEAAEELPPSRPAPVAPTGRRQEPRGATGEPAAARTPGGRKRLAPGPPARPAAAASARRRALLAANEAEEREIRRLERRLGLRKRRKKAPERGQGEAALPRSFARDGLGYVLGALEAGGAACPGLYESSEEEEEEEEEREAGGRTREPREELSLMEEEEEGGDDDGDSSSLEEVPGSSEESPVEGGSVPHGGRSPEAGAQESMPAGDESICHNATKYVPPQMRKSEERIDARKREELERLKKTLKGLINRLSEPNLASVSGQLEDLYMANSRKDMNETLTDILLSACVTESAMPSRLVMEHVLLLSVLHCTVGIEVGAHFLETVVQKFDEVYRSEAEGKECENLLTLIAHLYNFYVVHSLLIFDILKKLVSTFSEKDIELMLLLLKNVGFSLRKDDALALKELITEAQKKANAVGKQFLDQSRVCFMLEIMLALKNNDMRKIPGYDPEPIEKLRKLQRTLTCKNGSGKEAQLRVSLDSLLSADQIGRWWIVGSSWSGAPMIEGTSNGMQQILPKGKVSSKILELARKQRMNTDIRRNIFCILMTSEDFLDAFEKLLKLGLKDQQEREIVHVLVDCCLQEKTYNPFYAYLSAKFCEYERRFQVTFQFSIWDKIRDPGSLSATAFSNLVHLLAHLLKARSVSLTVFKVIEFSELDKPKVHLLRQVLTALLLTTDPEELSSIFGKLADNPKLGMLHEGLKLFLTHFLLKNIQAHKSIEEATLLKERIELVNRTLKAKESRLKL